MRQFPCGVLALVLVLVPARAYAQLLLTDRSSPDHRALLSVGWESTWTVRLGYARALPGPSPATVDVGWTVPVAVGNPFRGGRIDAGFNPLVVSGRGLGAAASVRSGISWSADPLGERASWTAGVSLAPGWYNDQWNVAAEVSWRSALATWMAHAEVVRDLRGDLDGVNPNEAPRHSFFALTAQRVGLGVRGGYAPRRGVGVLARGGLDLAPQAQGIMGVPPIYTLPFYADLAGDYRW